MHKIYAQGKRQRADAESTWDLKLGHQLQLTSTSELKSLEVRIVNLSSKITLVSQGIW